MAVAASGTADPFTLAQEALAAIDSGKALAPFSQRVADFTLDQAYAVTAELRRLRQARGEKPVGRKIGFTNRTIWAEYGVFAPIWGDMYDSTVHALSGEADAFPLGPMREPRIEPEIAFRLRGVPTPDMDDAALAGCIEWVAHGFEIVQSPFPGWKFAAADAIAAGAVHGAYLLGPSHALDQARRSDWLRDLATFTVTLRRNGEVMDRGGGANVLDSPIVPLRHLVALLAGDRHNPPLAAGEIVTTGTLTRALPIGPGETWATELDGIALAGIAAAFR